MTSFQILEKSLKVIMPKGEYWVGDPCYFVPEGEWIPWLDAADYRNNKDLVAEINEFPVVGFSTKYGDGVYHADGGALLAVDSGLIGLVPTRLAHDKYVFRERGFKHTFKSSALCFSDNEGNIFLGDITISTGDKDDTDFDW